MKHILLILVMGAFSFANAQTPTTVNVVPPVKLKQIITDANLPAIAIGIIENGELKQIYAEGTIPSGKVQQNTIFDVASITKTITTLLTLQLVDDKEWNLDEPLAKYWIDPDVKDDPRHKKLTTRHVLSHSTGFKNWRWMRESKKLTFDFDPGTKCQYSGEGFEYLRKALENKFGTSFESMVDSLLFTPNNIKSSYLTWSDKMDSTQFAGTYDKEGKLYEYSKALQANAADNLMTTIADLGKLSTMVMNQELLTTKTQKEMIRPHTQAREGVNFGLGWIVFENLPNDEYALFNAGSDKGVNALTVLLPKTKRGILVFTNGDSGRSIAIKLIAQMLGQTGKEIIGRF